MPARDFCALMAARASLHVLQLALAGLALAACLLLLRLFAHQIICI